MTLLDTLLPWRSVVERPPKPGGETKVRRVICNKCKSNVEPFVYGLTDDGVVQIGVRCECESSVGEHPDCWVEVDQ